MNEVILFGMPTNPIEWVIILAVVMLLFGGSKLPQLAKALGQSKRAFKDGLDEAEEESQRDREKARQQQQPLIAAGQSAPPALSAIDDEALFEEARQRAARMRAADTARLDDAKPTASGQAR